MKNSFKFILFGFICSLTTAINLSAMFSCCIKYRGNPHKFDLTEVAEAEPQKKDFISINGHDILRNDFAVVVENLRRGREDFSADFELFVQACKKEGDEYIQMPLKSLKKLSFCGLIKRVNDPMFKAIIPASTVAITKFVIEGGEKSWEILLPGEISAKLLDNAICRLSESPGQVESDKKSNKCKNGQNDQKKLIEEFPGEVIPVHTLANHIFKNSTGVIE